MISLSVINPDKELRSQTLENAFRCSLLESATKYVTSAASTICCLIFDFSNVGAVTPAFISMACAPKKKMSTLISFNKAIDWGPKSAPTSFWSSPQLI